MKQLRAVGQLLSRGISTSCRRDVSMKQSLTDAKGMCPSNPRYENMQRLQSEFAKTPELLVWQKRGIRDTGLYQATLLLMVGGTILCLNTLWTMSWPRPQE